MDRRHFLKTTAAAAAWTALSTGFSAREAFATVCTPLRTTTFPYLEVSGTPEEIGIQIGRRFGGNIRKGIERRAAWFTELKEYALGTGKRHYDAMLRAAQTHTPGPLMELQGWAKGSEIPFEHLFILNCKSEFDTFMKKELGCDGCSTVVLKDDKRLIVMHNEDGHKAYEDLMFVLRVKPKDGTEFIALTYPSVIEGNAPGINEHGVLVTTNYISSVTVKEGVPRYFLDRMMLEAKTVDEALKLATHPERGYAYHHILASIKEGRAISVEATPDETAVKEIEGLYWHTNHLILPSTKDHPQFQEYTSSSSVPRYQSLSRILGPLKDPAKVTEEQMLDALSDHVGAPYGLCRHPAGDVHGSTLATAVFSTERPDRDKTPGQHLMHLYRSNPCRRIAEDHWV